MKRLLLFSVFVAVSIIVAEFSHSHGEMAVGTYGMTTKHRIKYNEVCMYNFDNQSYCGCYVITLHEFLLENKTNPDITATLELMDKFNTLMDKKCIPILEGGDETNKKG